MSPVAWHHWPISEELRCRRLLDGGGGRARSRANLSLQRMKDRIEGGVSFLDDLEAREGNREVGGGSHRWLDGEVAAAELRTYPAIERGSGGKGGTGGQLGRGEGGATRTRGT